MFEAAKGAYMSVYTPAQKEISTGHVNYECIKNCVLSFLQPDSLILIFIDIQCIFYYKLLSQCLRNIIEFLWIPVLQLLFTSSQTISLWRI